MIKLKTIIENVQVEKYVYHISNPKFRNKILKRGILPKVGEQRFGEWNNDIPAIFVCNTSNKKKWFDSTYDDDVWKIDTSKLNNEWQLDKNYTNNKFLVTFDKIPSNAITLIYAGTGKSK